MNLTYSTLSSAWAKTIISWQLGKTLYLSVPFTWLMPKAEKMAKAHKGPVIAGGPAVKLLGAPWAKTPDHCDYDVLAMHNPFATFTSRGCPRNCEFCAVPKIEGDLVELTGWKPAPLVCDNNFLACSKRHIERAIDTLTCFPRVDFNQGLDARIFRRDSWFADQLARLAGLTLRFAFDSWDDIEAVHNAIVIARARGFRDICIYVLVNHPRESHEDDLRRLETVRSWGLRPNPMRYQPLDTFSKNSYVAPGRTQQELLRLMEYYWRLRWLEHIPYAEYQYHSANATPDMIENLSQSAPPVDKESMKKH